MQDQQTVTTSIQVSNLQSDASLVVQSQPSSVSDSYDSSGEPIATMASGFKVTGIAYNETDATWVVGVLYTAGVPNVVSSLYISKPGTVQPYSTTAQNTYYISQHPCMTSQSVCCMLDYRDRYQLGYFATNITDDVKTCDATISSANTLDLGFNPDGSAHIIDHVFDGYPDSWVERIGPGTLPPLFVFSCFFPW